MFNNVMIRFGQEIASLDGKALQCCFLYNVRFQLQSFIKILMIFA